jgi:hypothetical protein
MGILCASFLAGTKTDTERAEPPDLQNRGAKQKLYAAMSVNTIAGAVIAVSSISVAVI